MEIISKQDERKDRFNISEKGKKADIKKITQAKKKRKKSGTEFIFSVKTINS